MMWLINKRLSSFLSLHYGIVLILINIFAISCVSKNIQYEVPPSRHALTRTSQLHVDSFSGQNFEFMKNILIQEIYRIPNFDYLELYPDENQEQAAIISGEILVYSARDESEQRDKINVKLIQRDIIKRPEGSSQRIRKRVFDFAEVPFRERAVHRTLDLQIRFTVTSAITGKILYKNIEKTSYQQSYIGEERILLIPRAADEMERLGRKLSLQFLERLNPSLSRKKLVLETGSASVPNTFEYATLGHPKILKGNRFAVAQDYDLAIKIWNYVLFSPPPYKNAQTFEFTDNAYENFKTANVPPRLIQSLLKWYGQTLSLAELERELPKVIGITQFRNYGAIIKSHARATKEEDNLNLAAAHNNIGSVYRLQSKLRLAAYHYAKANSYRPLEKYAQAWTDIQQEMGDFDPLNPLVKNTIEAAVSDIPPPDALVKAENVLAEVQARDKEGFPQIQSIELPFLFQENRPSANPSTNEPRTLDLN